MKHLLLAFYCLCTLACSSGPTDSGETSDESAPAQSNEMPQAGADAAHSGSAGQAASSGGHQEVPSADSRDRPGSEGVNQGGAVTDETAMGAAGNAQQASPDESTAAVETVGNGGNQDIGEPPNLAGTENSAGANTATDLAFQGGVEERARGGVEMTSAMQDEDVSTLQCAVACADNAACIEVDEAPTCVCNGGFEGDGTRCRDIDECALNIDNCAP